MIQLESIDPKLYRVPTHNEWLTDFNLRYSLEEQHAWVKGDAERGRIQVQKMRDAAKEQFIDNVQRLHSLAMYFNENPGLARVVERDTDRAIAHAVANGRDPDDRGYKAFRRSLAISKEVNDPTAKISTWFDAHYGMQKRLHDSFYIDETPFPTWREYIRGRIRLLDTAETETPLAEPKSKSTTSKRTPRKQKDN